MEIRTKKRNADGIVRLETSGKLKEVIISENFLDAKNAKVSLCFRGKSSSGIVDLSFDEINSLFDKVMPNINILKGIKVMEFKK
ncbi:hypothetical protein B6U91_02365 [Candidatus Pacearchaeota archaeon ex4484_71]|nr:MAG: hypothetical protein B6U91_02365 [Candidatus Pacearchaeota archaeon ex4484_71]